MSLIHLSAENERFLQSKVDAGCFATLDEALNAVVKEQRSWDEAVREKVAEGLADLEAGRYTDYDDESLKKYFDELIAEIPAPAVQPQR